MVAAYFFARFTASINEAQGMGGPVNISFSSAEWFYVVLMLNAVLILAAFGGVKLLGPDRHLAGALSLLVGASILVLGVRNHLHAPPLEGVNDTNLMPVAPFLHYAVYGFAGTCLLGGAWLLASGPAQKNRRGRLS